MQVILPGCSNNLWSKLEKGEIKKIFGKEQPVLGCGRCGCRVLLQEGDMVKHDSSNSGFDAEHTETWTEIFCPECKSTIKFNQQYDPS